MSIPSCFASFLLSSVGFGAVVLGRVALLFVPVCAGGGLSSIERAGEKGQQRDECVDVMESKAMVGRGRRPPCPEPRGAWSLEERVS